MAGLTAFLASISEVVAALLAILGDVIDLIVSTPVLAIPTAVALLGYAINVIRNFVFGQNR